MDPLTIRVPLTDEKLRDVLTDAFEGGIDYWMDRYEYIEPTQPHEDADRLRSDSVKDYPPYAWLPLVPWSSVMVYTDDDPHEPHYLNRAALQQGLDLLPSVAEGRHMRALLKGNHDAETADVLVQLSLFGEVVYG